MEDKLAALTWRFATLDHTWDKEKAALEAGRVTASTRVDDLELELLQVKYYIHAALDMEYGRKGDEPSEPQ